MDEDENFPQACPEYDREIMSKLSKMQSISPYIFIVISTVLCAACYKYRKLAEFFIYIECFSSLCLFSRPKMNTNATIEPMFMYLIYLF